MVNDLRMRVLRASSSQTGPGCRSPARYPIFHVSERGSTRARTRACPSSVTPLGETSARRPPTQGIPPFLSPGLSAQHRAHAVLLCTAPCGQLSQRACTRGGIGRHIQGGIYPGIQGGGYTGKHIPGYTSGRQGGLSAQSAPFSLGRAGHTRPLNR